MRRKHYSIHTERTYCDWIRRFILFHRMQEKDALFVEGEKKIEDYLTHLAMEGKLVPAGLDRCDQGSLLSEKNKYPCCVVTGGGRFSKSIYIFL